MLSFTVCAGCNETVTLNVFSLRNIFLLTFWPFYECLMFYKSVCNIALWMWLCICVQAPEGEPQPMTEVDLFISTQRIKVLNADSQVLTLIEAQHTYKVSEEHNKMEPSKL